MPLRVVSAVDSVVSVVSFVVAAVVVTVVSRVYAEVLDSTLEDAIIKQEGILEKTASNAMSASASL